MKQLNERLWPSLRALLIFCLSLAFLFSRAEEAKSASGLTLTVGSSSGPPGASLLVPVQATGFSDLSTFQFTFHFDPTNLAFLDVGSFLLTGLAGGNFGTNQATNGILTVSWDDLGGM